MIYTNKRNNGKQQERDDDTLGFMIETMQGPKLMRVNITDEFKEPSYYDMVFHALIDLDEGDRVVFTINSPGGRLDGLAMLLEGIAQTEATTVAHIVGSAHSCASILAIACDEVHVGDYAEMLVHSARFGIWERAADVKAYNVHAEAYCEGIMRQVYAGFLTEEETAAILGGKEHWMLPDEIRERVARRDPYNDALIAAAEKEVTE